jgi:hypothetical protein
LISSSPRIIAAGSRDEPGAETPCPRHEGGLPRSIPPIHATPSRSQLPRAWPRHRAGAREGPPRPSARPSPRPVSFALKYSNSTPNNASRRARSRLRPSKPLPQRQQVVTQPGHMVVVVEPSARLRDCLIAQGSDGAEVFLAFRDFVQSDWNTIRADAAPGVDGCLDPPESGAVWLSA